MTDAVSALASILVAHQRSSNLRPPPGTLLAQCRCGWSRSYDRSRRGDGIALWCAHVAGVAIAELPEAASEGGDL